MNKEEKEIRKNNTDNYRKAGLIIMIVMFVIAMIYASSTKDVFNSCLIAGSGISINILLQITHSICYRLDLIIDKK